MRTIIISAYRFRNAATIVAAGLLLVGAAAAGTPHEYTISVDASFERLHVEAHFTNRIERISARSRDARHFLRDLRECDSGDRLTAGTRRLRLPRGGVNCITYAVDLDRAARAERLNRRLDPANIVVSPALWMWRPELGGEEEIRVQFRLPDNVGVSVPWQKLPAADNTYLLKASPESGDAIAVFGEFESTIVSVPGAAIEVTLLRSQNDIDFDEIAAWVRDVAGNVVLAYGRFPNPEARIVVIPVGSHRWGGDSPVPFGRVVRDGGETIELLINDRRPVADYYDEWEPTHELAHLMLPYLHRGQRWIAEGFATYYQNVLLARAGRYTEQDAWRRLVAGFGRGRESVPALSPNDAAGGSERSTRMKIYWSGAALALIADVELRRRSNGRESLDSLLGRLQHCCLPSARTWSGPELFQKLDSLLDEPLFMALYAHYADTPGFPAVEPLLMHLGVADEDGNVQLRSHAELAHIRRSITASD